MAHWAQSLALLRCLGTCAGGRAATSPSMATASGQTLSCRASDSSCRWPKVKQKQRMEQQLQMQYMPAACRAKRRSAMAALCQRGRLQTAACGGRPPRWRSSTAGWLPGARPPWQPPQLPLAAGMTATAALAAVAVAACGAWRRMCGTQNGLPWRSGELPVLQDLTGCRMCVARRAPGRIHLPHRHPCTALPCTRTPPCSYGWLLPAGAAGQGRGSRSFAHVARASCLAHDASYNCPLLLRWACAAAALSVAKASGARRAAVPPDFEAMP